MATRTISASGGTRAYSDTATWDEGAVPTSADDVVARGDGTSGAVTIAGAAACRSADFTNYSNTLTHNAGVTWTIGTGTSGPGGLALKLVPAMTYTPLNTTTSIIAFNTTQAAQKITFGTRPVGSLSFGNSGGWQLQDALTQISTANILTHTFGTLDLNGQTIQIGNWSSNNTGTRVITFGAATITITNSGPSWSINDTTNLTVNSSSETLIFTSSASTQMNVAGTTGTGKTFNSVRFTGTGAAAIIGANTFGTLERSNAAAVTLTLPASATTTVTTLVLVGTKGNLLTVNSSSGGTAATVSVASGVVLGKYLSLKDSTATGGATFIAQDSTNVSGNTGWTFRTSIGSALNDLMLCSLRSTYSSTACLQDLLTRFEADNSIKGQASWYSFYGGTGDFNDTAYAYWSTH